MSLDNLVNNLSDLSINESDTNNIVNNNSNKVENSIKKNIGNDTLVLKYFNVWKNKSLKKKSSKLNVSTNNCLNNNKITVDELWDKIVKNIKNFNKDYIVYILDNYGTKEPCNRFDIGNCIEYEICNYFKSIGFTTKELPNAKRADCLITGFGLLSFKYSSSGDITLHNSNSCINKDEKMIDTILLTTEKLYLINESLLKKIKINVDEYIQNKGDSLKLKRKLLTQLKKQNYKYQIDFKLNIDKSKCKNNLCSKVFYETTRNEFNSQKKNNESCKNKK